MTTENPTTADAEPATVTPITPARPRRQSRASRASEKAAGNGKASAAEKTTLVKKPSAAKPAKDGALKPGEMRTIVMAALVRAGAEVLESWSDPRVPKSSVKQLLSNRLSYCPGGSEIWDSRLGPRPRGGKS